MKFKRKFRGYSTTEVDKYVSESEQRLQEVTTASIQKDERIDSLNAEVERLNAELSEQNKKREMINEALCAAVDRAKQIDEQSEARYRSEMERLKVFHEKWCEHYKKLVEAYPLDDAMIALGKFTREMSEALSEPQKQFEEETARLTQKKRLGYIEIDADGEEEDETDDFDPAASIREYLASQPQDVVKKRAKKKSNKRSKSYRTGIARVSPALSRPSESGFDFEEALNPTEDLADIMKDLGLLED